ncbi:MAG: response regulator [Myxococcota bacterium]
MTRETVLVIDDDRLVLDRAKSALEKVGCTVVVSASPGLPDGVDPAGIDLVLLDVNMPDYFGDDLAQVLPDLGVKAPIYLYSSIEEAKLREIAHAAGVAGAINKQLTFTQMAEEVLAILASRGSSA